MVKNLSYSAASVAGPLAAAQITKGVAGIGLSGSAGAGLIIGMGASVSVQLVADPQGNVGISLGGSFSNFLIGAGAMGGVQGTLTNATSIRDLNGPSGGFDISAGAGSAVDVGIQGGLRQIGKKLSGQFPDLPPSA